MPDDFSYINQRLDQLFTRTEELQQQITELAGANANSRLDELFEQVEEVKQRVSSIMDTGEGKINCAEANVKSLFSHEDIQGQKNIRATEDIVGAGKLEITGESKLSGDVKMEGSATVGGSLTAVDTLEGEQVKARGTFTS